MLYYLEIQYLKNGKYEEYLKNYCFNSEKEIKEDIINEFFDFLKKFALYEEEDFNRKEYTFKVLDRFHLINGKILNLKVNDVTKGKK